MLVIFVSLKTRVTSVILVSDITEVKIEKGAATKLGFIVQVADQRANGC